MRLWRAAAPWLGALLVLTVASALYLPRLGEPRGALWDESYYLTANERYRQGLAQFASHPPLGLMLIAAGDAAWSPNSGLNSAALAGEKKVKGDAIPKGYRFEGVRIASALAGVFAALAFYALLLVTTRSPVLAAVFAMPALLETAFVAQYRAAHLDSFQVLAGLLVMLGCAMAVRRGRLTPGLAVGVGAAAGAAALVKASGAVLLIAPALVLLGWLVGAQLDRARLARGTPLSVWDWMASCARDARGPVFAGLLVLAGTGAALAGVYTAQAIVSPEPPQTDTRAGKRDAAFLSPPYRAYLEDRRGLDPIVVGAAAWDSIRFVANDLEHMARVDKNASAPVSWLWRMKSVNYRWDSQSGITRYVHFVANPVTAALGLLALLLAPAVIWSGSRATTPQARERAAQAALLLGTYAVFMAIHVWLGGRRVMYGYHYFIPLLISLALLPLAWQAAAERWRAVARWRVPALSVMAGLCAAAFAFYAPLVLHLPLTRAACEARNALGRVLTCQPSPEFLRQRASKRAAEAHRSAADVEPAR